MEVPHELVHHRREVVLVPGPPVVGNRDLRVRRRGPAPTTRRSRAASASHFAERVRPSPRGRPGRSPRRTPRAARPAAAAPRPSRSCRGRRSRACRRRRPTRTPTRVSSFTWTPRSVNVDGVVPRVVELPVHDVAGAVPAGTPAARSRRANCSWVSSSGQRSAVEHLNVVSVVDRLVRGDEPQRQVGEVRAHVGHRLAGDRRVEPPPRPHQRPPVDGLLQVVDALQHERRAVAASRPATSPNRSASRMSSRWSRFVTSCRSVMHVPDQHLAEVGLAAAALRASGSRACSITHGLSARTCRLFATASRMRSIFGRFRPAEDDRVAGLLADEPFEVVGAGAQVDFPRGRVVGAGVERGDAVEVGERCRRRAGRRRSVRRWTPGSIRFCTRAAWKWPGASVIRRIGCTATAARGGCGRRRR